MTSLNLEKISERLSPEARATLFIQDVIREDENRYAFNDAEINEIIEKFADKKDRERCWYILELCKWARLLWKSEILYQGEFLILTIQNLIVLQTYAPHPPEDLLILYRIEQLKDMVEINLPKFLAFRKAIQKIEEIVGTRIFNEPELLSINYYFDMTNGWQSYNVIIDELGRDPNSKIAIPEVKDEYVNDFVQEISQLAKNNSFPRRNGL
jgi:hypothetical protein